MSEDSNSQQPQSPKSVRQENHGSMGGGQQAAIGNNNIQVNGNSNTIIQTNASDRGKLNPRTDNFLGLLVWIDKNSHGAGLEKLDRGCRDKLVIALDSAHKLDHDFTEFEVDVLKLVVTYCCFFSQRLRIPWEKFEDFKEKTYYSEMRKIASSKRSIRCGNICLSSLVKDKHLYHLLETIEQ